MLRKIVLLVILALLLTGCNAATPAPVTTNNGPSAASGSAVATNNTKPVTTAQPKLAGGRLYVRGGPNASQLTLLKLPDGITERQLSPGVPDTEWNIVYSTQINGDRTTVTATALASGTIARSNTFNGRFTLPQVDGNTRLGGLSLNGQTIVLEEVLTDQQRQSFKEQKHWLSRFAVLNTGLQSAPHFVELDGQFSYDTLSADGKRLFLIEQLPEPGHYQVRVYDLALNKLVAEAVFEKSEQSAIMEGYPGAQLTSPKGDWVYTVYRNKEHGPFVHALNTEATVAVCIDLPKENKENDQAALRWGLTMSRDGSSLYAVNTVLGKIMSITPDWPQAGRTGTFSSTSASSKTTPAGTSTTVLSPDGKTLYTLTDNGVLVFDPDALKVRKQIAAGLKLDSLAISSDGSQLYATSSEKGKVLVLNADTGAVLAELAAGSQPLVLLRVDNRNA
jgi:outer membrane protein assembly factor BamB